MNIYRKFVWAMLVVPLLLTGNTIAADDKTPSGTLIIDETQVMLLLGGDMGGGTLLFGDNSYSFKTGGIKIGGVGVHKVHMVGEVYDLNDIADFPGVYFVAEAGATLGDSGTAAIWLKNSKGVSLHMKTSEAKGIALSVGVEGLKITMK